MGQMKLWNVLYLLSLVIYSTVEECSYFYVWSDYITWRHSRNHSSAILGISTWSSYWLSLFNGRVKLSIISNIIMYMPQLIILFVMLWCCLVVPSCTSDFYVLMLMRSDKERNGQSPGTWICAWHVSRIGHTGLNSANWRCLSCCCFIFLLIHPFINGGDDFRLLTPSIFWTDPH